MCVGRIEWVFRYFFSHMRLRFSTNSGMNDSDLQKILFNDTFTQKR